MSIIHDALKKVQESKPANAMNTNRQSLPENNTEKQNDNFNIPLFVAAGCAVIAMIFAFLPHINLSAAPKKQTTTPTLVTPIPKPLKPAISTQQAAAEIISALKKPAQDATDLNIPKQITAPQPSTGADQIKNIQVEGILEMNGKKAVLINGNIYEEGQSIYGKTIKSIRFNSLVIADSGNERTIWFNP